MWIRYIALTDDSPIGKDAALYCDALVATGMPVRLVPARVAELQVDSGGRCHSAWDRHRGLLVTPMVGPFVNVVCSEVADWARYYTEGVTNALLIAYLNYDRSLMSEADAERDRILARETISKYELLYASSRSLADFVAKLTGGPVTYVPIFPSLRSRMGGAILSSAEAVPVRATMDAVIAADSFRNLVVF